MSWPARSSKQTVRSKTRPSSGRGRGAETVSPSGVTRVTITRTNSLAFPETLRVAGIANRGRVPLTPLSVNNCRWRSRRQKRRKLVVFVVDASGSMAAAARMRTAKAAALTLLERAYRQRAFVAVVSFRNENAEVLLPPTTSAFLAFQRLQQLPAGGATPLAEGLRAAKNLIQRALDRTPNIDPFVVLITDGRATEGLHEAEQLAREYREQGLPALCIDTESGPVRLGQTLRLAGLMKADYVHTSELPAGQWAPIIEEWLSWKA